MIPDLQNYARKGPANDMQTLPELCLQTACNYACKFCFFFSLTILIYPFSVCGKGPHFISAMAGSVALKKNMPLENTFESL